MYFLVTDGRILSFSTQWSYFSLKVISESYLKSPLTGKENYQRLLWIAPPNSIFIHCLALLMTDAMFELSTLWPELDFCSLELYRKITLLQGSSLVILLSKTLECLFFCVLFVICIYFTVPYQEVSSSYSCGSCFHISFPYFIM